MSQSTRAKHVQCKTDTQRPAPKAPPTVRPMTPVQRLPSCPCTGGCPRCTVQTKLTVGGLASPAEAEADRIADRVMNLPDAKVGFKPVTVAGKPEVGLKGDHEKEATPLSQRQELGLLGQLSGGDPMDTQLRQFFEPRFGYNFSHVRLHRDGAASSAARDLGARAFTVGPHIFFQGGEYSPTSHQGRHLIAHELTHVMQQDAGAPQQVRSSQAVRPFGNIVRRKPQKARKPLPRASETQDLMKKKTFKPEGANVQLFENEQKAIVPVKFGTIAKGELEVEKDKDEDLYTFKKKGLTFDHNFFIKLREVAPELEPVLITHTSEKGDIKGWVGLKLQTAKNYPDYRDLLTQIRKYSAMLGLPDYDLGTGKIENKLLEGDLIVAVKDIDLKLGSVLSGKLSFGMNNETATFNADLNASVSGLGQGQLQLERKPTGVVTGKGSANLQLTQNYTGQAEIGYNGKTFYGKGKLGYTGEKFSGHVQLIVMDEAEAKKLSQQKQAVTQKTGNDADAAAGKAPADPKPKENVPAKAAPTFNKKAKYVVFGDGELDYTFTEWLSGKAQVIFNHEGHVTVIGEIRPQKEIELFAQRDFEKKLGKLEARAVYGIPVVGNVFIFANIGLEAFANLGPGKLYNIVVSGTYSTDPKQANSFQIQGSLNISAAAGLRVRGEAGAGLTILAHDIKAGAGLNGIVGIRGYAEATPIVGYREKQQKEGEDKKGEFFIKGSMELAAQPFLGLSGDLFVEVDSPWWSPLGDERWTWPLGSKEWPIGGSYGIGADVEYVFGSNKAPDVSFKPVEFSADKFMTDLYSDKAKNKSKRGDEKGSWKEKNSKKADPPPKTGPDKSTKGKKGPPQKGKAQKTEDGKRGSKASDKAKGANGKTVAQMKRDAAENPNHKKGHKPKGSKSSQPKGVDKNAKQNEAEKQKAALKIRSAMGKGIMRSDLLKLLKKLKSVHKLREASLNKQDDAIVKNSPAEEIKGKRKTIGVYDKKTTTGKSGQTQHTGKYIGPKDSPKGVTKLGTYQSTSSAEKRTLKPILKPALDAAVEAPHFPFDGWPDSAHRPVALNAELFVKRELATKARTSRGGKTTTVGHFGNLENRIISGSELPEGEAYEGGHLLGNQFGGPEAFENLVPQRGNSVNRKLFGGMETFISNNLPKAAKKEATITLNVQVSYFGERSVELNNLIRRVAGDANLQGRNLSNEPKLTTGSFNLSGIDLTIGSLDAHAAGVIAQVNANFAGKITPVSSGANLTTKRTNDRWELADSVSKQIFGIRKLASGFVVQQVDPRQAKSYYAAKDPAGSPLAPSPSRILKFPSRIPNKIDADVTLRGLENYDPLGLTKGQSEGGADVAELDYFIVLENGQEVPVPTGGAAPSQAQLSAAGGGKPPKELVLKTKISLNTI